MIIGQTIFAGTFFSPWFPRQGDAAVFSGEVIAFNGASTLSIFVQTKNLEETDTQAGTLTSGSMVWDATSIAVKTTGGGTPVAASGAKELVRFKYVLSAASGYWAHLRVLPPAWQQN